jgi:hypothetical protein
MQLYLIDCDNEDDENLDLAIMAPTKEIAIDLWRRHWLAKDYMEQTAYLSVPIQFSETNRRAPGYDEMARVFVATPTGRMGVLDYQFDAGAHSQPDPASAGAVTLLCCIYP